MDTTKAVTHVSLCAGYGGIDLGLNRAIPNLLTVAFSEIEAFACANLVSKMEAGLMDCAPIWTDLKTFPYEQFHGRVDILSGGYPCQPFSAAGKRLGREDPRHLWPWIADGIAAMRPAVCFFENVEGHISMGLSDVIEDLAGMGYRTTWGIFSAREVGAPHQRKRVFIMAYDCSNGCDRRAIQDRIRQWIVPQLSQLYIRECSEIWSEVEGCDNDSRELAHRIDKGSQGLPWDVSDRSQSRRNGEEAHGSVSESSICVWPSRPGQPQHGWEPPRVVGDTQTRRGGESGDKTSEGQGHRSARSSRSDEELSKAEPTLGRDSNGSADWLDDAELYTSCDNRTDELRLLGNGVVPATAERAFRTILTELLS